MQASLILAIPFSLCQGLCFYVMNLKQSILEVNFDHKEIYGFMVDYKYNELEYCIMIVYLCLQMYYERQVKRKKNIVKTHQSQISLSNNSKDVTNIQIKEFSLNDKGESVIRPGSKSESEIVRQEKKEDKEISFTYVFIASIAKYSDVFSLFILFWISLYTVNVIHLILAFFFLLFFIQLGTSLSTNKTKNSKSGNKKAKTYNFVRKFWVFLIVYVNIIIFLRYLWVVFIVPYLGQDFLSYPAVIFIGITYDYKISPSIGLVNEGITKSNNFQNILIFSRLWRGFNSMDIIYFYCFAIRYISK